jgi:phosphomethylpyrimidine synthase
VFVLETLAAPYAEKQKPMRRVRHTAEIHERRTDLEYKTQMEAAKKGIVTSEISQAAKKEYINEETLMQYVLRGVVALPHNVLRKSSTPKAIGSMLSTKINVNLGTSKDCGNMETELEKAAEAEKMGADAIMDLSTFGDTRKFRQRLASECKAILGSVPIYDALVHYNKPLAEITSDEWLETARIHAEDGMDFMTIHAGLNRENAARFLKNRSRITNIVSRGGSLMFAWMQMTGNENPFYERYDELLEICREYDVTLSLGDACRPGCLSDASDATQLSELVTLGELTKRAWDRDVSVIIEGPGHMPLDQIEANVKIQQTLCRNAPFYVLGPLVTDIAPGYDHITSAIGGAIAAWHGAAFLCYVTPAEHLCLPNAQDVRDGIAAAKIAAHAADIAKGIPHARNIDDQMAKARQEIDWEKMFSLAIDPDKARERHCSSPPEQQDTCTMCGKFCAMRNMNKILRGEDITVV